MSQTIERKRRRTSSIKKLFKIRVRYKFHTYKKIETEDFGSFKEMYEKYKGKYLFYCADQPPDDFYGGYRLDSDVTPEHTRVCLEKYGSHKAWIDPIYKVDGKAVVLVFNAHHGDAYKKGKINLRQYRQLSGLELVSKFGPSRKARKAAKKQYHRIEKELGI